MDTSLQARPAAQNGTSPLIARQDLPTVVADVMAATPVVDMHTHLSAPFLGELGLWGIDELLTYHYLEAEIFRFSRIEPTAYWALSKAEQADLIWQTLFVEHAPVSEATRGVVAVLQAFGLDTHARDLRPLREFFREQTLDQHTTQVFRLAGIQSAVMTNDPLDSTLR